jgi:hypothetical protein
MGEAMGVIGFAELADSLAISERLSIQGHDRSPDAGDVWHHRNSPLRLT